MKDYSKNLEEKKNFVLNYKIIEDTIDEVKDTIIVVKFATGEEWRIPYTEENEKKVLDKMKKQVDESRELIEKKRTSLIAYKITSIVMAIVAGGTLMYAYFSNYSTIINVLFSILDLTFVGISAVTLINYLKDKKLIKDYEKNAYFVKIEEELNNKIKSNENVLSKTSSRTRNMVENVLDNSEPVFNINSFNRVPYSDIKQIMCNIKRDEAFGFDYDSDEVINASVKKKIRKI